MTGLTVTAALKFQSAPPVRAATAGTGYTSLPTVFQSAPPVRAATRIVDLHLPGGDVSIRAACEGGDHREFHCPARCACFNPRRL